MRLQMFIYIFRHTRHSNNGGTCLIEEAIPMRSYLVLIVLLLISFDTRAQKLSGVVKGGGPTAIVLEPVPAKAFPPSSQTATMDQRGLKFSPTLLVVQQGTTVEFKNSDTVSHNIFWPNISGNKKLGHNLGTAPSGQSQRFKLDTPGNIPILCNIHPEMSGYIVVSPSPYFAQTDLTGAYSINNVPEGAYKATAWHNGKAATVNVTVKGDTKLDF
jgi:plastocyanin